MQRRPHPGELRCCRGETSTASVAMQRGSAMNAGDVIRDIRAVLQMNSVARKGGLPR